MTLLSVRRERSLTSVQNKTLNWIKYGMVFAIGALFIIGPTFVYLIDKRFDQIIQSLVTK